MNRTSQTWMLVILLVFFQLGVNFYLVRAANTQQVLTGEEASVSFRDMFFFTERLQHNGYATPFTAYGFYAAGFRVVPAPDLFYGRWWKASFMALLPALVALYAIRRLGLSHLGALTAGMLAGLFPVVTGYSWLATDHGLETLFGLGGLLLVTTGWGPSVALAGFVAGLGAHQAAGMAFLPVLLGELYLFWRRDSGKSRALLWTAGALAALAFALALPSLWWTNHIRGFMGGGELIWPLGPLLQRNATLLFKELLVGGQSYYYFSAAPALSNPYLAAAVVAGFGVAVARWRTWWPVLTIAGLITGIVLVAGGVPGIRRMVIFFPMAALAVGGLVEWAAAILKKKTNPRVYVAAVSIGLASLLVVPFYQVGALADAYENGSIQLNLDFEFPMMQGKTMVETTDFLLDNPNVLLRYRELLSYDRLLAILHLLSEERDKPARQIATRELLLEDWKRKWPYLKELRPKTVL